MIQKTPIFFTKIITLTAACLMFSACTTDDVATTQQQPVKVEEKISATITKGMPRDEVVNLIGEPEMVETMKASDGGQVEIWRYKRVIGQTREYRVTGAEMVEQWSPSLGMWIEVPEEIEELVETTLTQTVEIVLHQDKVLTFSAVVDQDINIAD